MRVLHVVRSDDFAGVERHISTLAVAQAASGIEVTVVGGDRVAMARLEADGVRILGGDTFSETIRSVRRAGRHDLVHAHMTAGELAAAVSTRTPLVVTRHFARRRGTTPVGRMAGAMVRRRVSKQLAISQYVAQAVDGPSTVVYPGVDVQHHPHEGSRRPVVLVVQRLQPEKNTDVALRAFADGAPDDWTLEIVGHGPEEGSLRQLAQDLAVEDRVSFLGFRSDIPTLMRTSAVLIAPCEVEGLGLSVLEAMAYELPVVASDAGAHRETVGRIQSAQLFAAGDSTAAADMVRRLCLDPGLRRKYGEQLRAVQQATFTPEMQAEATERAYREALK